MKIYEILESGIKIVEYEPSLAAGIAELFNQQEDWGGSGSLKTESQILSNHKMSSFFNVYIALDGDKVVGYCSFARYFGDANTLYVDLLDVHPDYRNKKIGKALVLRCVKRTIELGYPRLDLFTWAGNTAAVPLYKKCGFMWEDRPDGTHLTNFLPTILSMPIFADFFEKADWYADSSRSLEIAPDGIEVNKFELFTYIWIKDDEKLSIGFERSGRQMQMIETIDYRIELIAQDHVLAFGTDYNCTFKIDNKTGKELNIKILGKSDKNIKFDYSLDTKVIGKKEFSAKFFVGQTDEVQDVWKVHPCLLADLEINGHAVTFGLGIETKFPLLIEVDRECTVDQIGMDVKSFINISSALDENAKITIAIPRSRLLTFKGDNFKTNKIIIDMLAKGKMSIPVITTTLGIGFEALKLKCTAVLANGVKFNFKATMYIYTQDMLKMLSGEDLHGYSMFNGPWRIRLAKDGSDGDLDDNEANIRHLTNSNVKGAFAPPKLGKPYDDEFNLLRPNVKMYKQNSTMIMEVEFISQKFLGMVVTQIYMLTATGIITRKSKIENRSDKIKHVMLQDGYYLHLGTSTIFSYKGQISQNHNYPVSNGIVNEIDGIDLDYFDENWVFEDASKLPRGYCWPLEYKPLIKWGNYVTFEIDPGKLNPGQIFETKPITFALGVFTSYNELRNYARQIYNYESVNPTHVIDVELNNYNPFLKDLDIRLNVINNREHILAGDIEVSSKGLFETVSQSNPEEELIERNIFDIKLSEPKEINLISVDLKTVAYEKSYSKVLFYPKGEIRKKQEGTLYSIENDAITFKVNPAYGNVCFSLTDLKGQEWLQSKYPKHEPYSWFNPFLGGIRINPPQMYSASAVLKEKITADFAKISDNLGNLWQGICITFEVNEFETYKGAIFKTYYLTLPGLPVLCSFYKFENKTGKYKHDEMTLSAYLNPDADAKSIIVEATSKDQRQFRFRMGTENLDDVNFENTVVIKGTREEKLYMFHGNKYNEKTNYFWGDNKIPVTVGTSISVRVAHKEVFTSSPLFLVLTDKELPAGSLDDLNKINFE